MVYQDFKHCTPIQIRFCDVDRLDHVNNACYLNYVELGRVNYFNHVFRDSIDWNKKGFVLARTEMDHLAPIFLNDTVYCFTKVEKLGTKSIQIQNIILKKAGEQIIECAKCIGILVAMDYKNGQSMELPEEWRQKVSAFEGL